MNEMLIISSEDVPLPGIVNIPVEGKKLNRGTGPAFEYMQSAAKSTDQSVTPPYSMKFGGINQPGYVRSAASPDLSFLALDFTMEFDIFPVKKDVQYPRVFQFGANWNTSQSLCICAGHADHGPTKYNLISYYLNQNSAPTLNSNADIAYGKWTHFKLQRVGNTISIYIDGVLDAQKTFPAGTLLTAGENDRRFFIGVSEGTVPTTSYFNGYIDNFKFYR